MVVNYSNVCGLVKFSYSKVRMLRSPRLGWLDVLSNPSTIPYNKEHRPKTTLLPNYHNRTLSPEPIIAAVLSNRSSLPPSTYTKQPHPSPTRLAPPKSAIISLKQLLPSFLPRSSSSDSSSSAYASESDISSSLSSLNNFTVAARAAPKKMSIGDMGGPAPSNCGGPDEWLEMAKKCKYLSEGDMKRLCELVKECLMEGLLSREPYSSHCCRGWLVLTLSAVTQNPTSSQFQRQSPSAAISTVSSTTC